ncbi:Scr1 family TA system antitoxin-like transcriptional regulator [Streptomyces radicis]|uniref:Scr1 family TA system antitoxin-like transcriptional regulator n=1 Tax=Streptomyces radicis TaxID=1750517 RepID=UPI0011C3F16D|nr:Scr1 family TA system antitoxin-like transcriptional regulator [Streptomyces radicis]
MSRIENGRLTIRRLELEALLGLCGVTDEATVAALTAMPRQARQKSWWHQSSQDLDPDFEERLNVEDGAARLHFFQPLLVHCLLQTPEYAEATMRNAWPSASREEIGTWVSEWLRADALPFAVCRCGLSRRGAGQ